MAFELRMLQEISRSVAAGAPMKIGGLGDFADPRRAIKTEGGHRTHERWDDPLGTEDCADDWGLLNAMPTTTESVLTVPSKRCNGFNQT